MSNITVNIFEDHLDIMVAYRRVLASQCGGNVMFVGTARDNSLGKVVTHLEFECYDSMAQKELYKIGQAVIENFQCENIAIYHRKGEVRIKDIAVVIAVSSPHRDAAFNGCRYAIDSLKKTVPIWKKEFYSDGSRWVSPTP